MYDFHYILYSFEGGLTGCAGDVTGIGIALALLFIDQSFYQSREHKIHFLYRTLFRGNSVRGTTTKMK